MGRTLDVWCRAIAHEEKKTPDTFEHCLAYLYFDNACRDAGHETHNGTVRQLEDIIGIL